MRKVNRVLIIAALTIASASVGSIYAQTDGSDNKTRQRVATAQEPKNPKPATQKPQTTTATGERLEPDDTSRLPGDVPTDTKANRQEQISEEEGAVVPYYNNFFNSYRLGPEDVISVQVFGQDRYSRAGIIIPPSGRVALALIPDGIFVNGKTVEEVSELIRKRYDEYIIDPQVTVSLDKASSYRYSILGDVGQPGVRLMTRRMTVTEAIAEAGGVLPTGDKSKVTVLRRQANGSLAPLAVNIQAIYKRGAPDTLYLVPGDQILVPGTRMKKIQQYLGFLPMLSFARVFGLPF
jgi:protein involved in polysaccharide export with SLBB domain